MNFGKHQNGILSAMDEHVPSKQIPSPNKTAMDEIKRTINNQKERNAIPTSPKTNSWKNC